MEDSFGKLVLSLPNGQRREFSLAKTSVSIGRSSINDIVLPEQKTSRVHSRVDCSQSGCTIVDLGSANGTRVNGQCVEQATLSPGDVVSIGSATLRFEPETGNADLEPTRLDTEEDLERTMAQECLTVQLGETETARLAVRFENRTWEVPLTGDVLTIGRQPGNSLTLSSPRISRQHARIERSGDQFVLVDQNSDNGTWVGGQRVSRHTLREGDTIRIGGAWLVFKQGFQVEELTVVDSPSARPARVPVVLVPGFMGSNLYRGSERVWPHLRNLARHPEMYWLPGSEDLVPRGVVDEVVLVPNLIRLEQYSRILEYLEENLGYERGKDLLEFAYDFRLDNRINARRLAATIEEWGVKAPVTIIAHSMGTLVSRYYVECLGGKQKVGRLVLLGGPTNGIPDSLVTLVAGNSPFPFGVLSTKLRDLSATFPSIYQTLPLYPCVKDQHGQPLDCYCDNRWLPESRRKHLEDARKFRTELGSQSSVPAVCIFGYGIKTITGVSMDRNQDGDCEKLDILVSTDGDSKVPELAAILEGAEIHPVRQYHGSLYVDNDVKMRLKMELTRHLAAARLGA